VDVLEWLFYRDKEEDDYLSVSEDCVKVTLVASTRIGGAFEQLDQQEESDEDFLAEFAGRACYQSWNRPNPKTATNKSYLAHILEVGHYSVLEHASATFYVEGVSRSLTHELVRHRHLSYSQLSQRYVKPADDGFWVQPPNVPHDLWAAVAPVLGHAVSNVYNALVAELENRGTLSKKQIREAARAVLPNCTETKIVVTGNMRAWRDMLQKRWHVAADAEICEFAGMILDQLRSIAPNTFQDVPGRPYGNEE
jgi:thymidylate synthase (FAD)